MTCGPRKQGPCMTQLCISCTWWNTQSVVGAEYVFVDSIRLNYPSLSFLSPGAEGSKIAAWQWEEGTSWRSGSRATWMLFTFPPVVKVRKVAADCGLGEWAWGLGAGIWGGRSWSSYPLLSCAQEHSQLTLLEMGINHSQAQGWAQSSVNSTLTGLLFQITPWKKCVDTANWVVWIMFIKAAVNRNAICE